MTEPGAPHGESKDFLMKKIGPLPLAAYLVTGAALFGFFLLKKRGSQNNTGSNIAQAPTGIVDPTTDQNAGLADQLNNLQTLLVEMQQTQGQQASIGNQLTAEQKGRLLDNFRGVFLLGAIIDRMWVQQKVRDYLRTHPQPKPVPVPVTPTPTNSHGRSPAPQVGAGGAETPRILPANFQRTPQTLGTEFTRQGINA